MASKLSLVNAEMQARGMQILAIFLSYTALRTPKTPFEDWRIPPNSGDCHFCGICGRKELPPLHVQNSRKLKLIN